MSRIKSIARVLTTPARKVKASRLRTQRAARPLQLQSSADTFSKTLKKQQKAKEICCSFVDRLLKMADGSNPNVVKKQSTNRIVTITKNNDKGVVTRYFVHVKPNGKLDGNFEYVKSYPDGVSIRRYADGRVDGRMGTTNPSTICKWGGNNNGISKSFSAWRTIRKLTDGMKKLLSE